MGNTLHILTLFGTSESVFGETPMHLCGFWFHDFDGIGSDKIIVSGINKLKVGKIDGYDGNPVIVHNEKWELFQQTYDDNNFDDQSRVVFRGICYTEQFIEDDNGNKISIPNAPKYVKLKSDCKIIFRRDIDHTLMNTDEEMILKK